MEYFFMLMGALGIIIVVLLMVAIYSFHINNNKKPSIIKDGVKSINYACEACGCEFTAPISMLERAWYDAWIADCPNCSSMCKYMITSKEVNNVYTTQGR